MEAPAEAAALQQADEGAAEEYASTALPSTAG